MKKFTRSSTERVLGGVMGGISAYIQIHAVVLRVLYIALLGCTILVDFAWMANVFAWSVFLYFITTWIIPYDYEVHNEARDIAEGKINEEK